VKKWSVLPTTTFRVEMMLSEGKEWIFVGNTTKTKYEHTGQTPGVTIYYRITATRADMESEPSQTVSVYAPSAQTALRLAA